ncbi:MAG TPA: response regulator, partial [Candidatus Acidoferrales bacterium]|nr:response regulator [Candidatus Acidoferrales bacterium]
LDLNLPKIDGLEVLRRVKADPRTRRIPVVVLTASKFDDAIAVCKRLGAESFIAKPVDFQNFSAMTLQLSLQWALLKPGPFVSA